ncbi:zinc ribbon domain-containing protein [Lactiplantibacillus plantarum]|uniref:zinc ribbon domain-containing protein n=1 Tax=Lactiplantibacillus plantarum TaxID=1590 RepID=UPI002E8E26E1|nr:zinc ribbon domain-containing protein [Lactiplantibacillus plantarum]
MNKQALFCSQCGNQLKAGAKFCRNVVLWLPQTRKFRIKGSQLPNPRIRLNVVVMIPSIKF